MGTKRTNKKKSGRGTDLSLVVWGIVLVMTAFRLHVAMTGNLTDHEALLSVCALHPQGAYLEGPAGVPLLLAVDHYFLGSGIMALRWISPIAALLLSWCLWWLARQLAPDRPAVALWSLVGVNLLPMVNLSSLVMDGALVTSSLVLLVLVAGWNAVIAERKKNFTAWILFGAALGIATLFFAPIGILLPLAVATQFFTQPRKSLNWRGVTVALALLAMGSIPALLWNLRHDWLQWSSVAQGFDAYRLNGHLIPLSWAILLSSLGLLLLMLLTATGFFIRVIVAILLLGSAALSGLLLGMPQEISDLSMELPSPRGVQGVGDLAEAIVSLREKRPGAAGETSPSATAQKPFLVASDSRLAALLGEKIQLTYPESPVAPSVFVAESPSLNSSYALWPGYADAVTSAAKDINYSEEKFVSPFLGRNALYVTTEAPNELPQTITGAFNAVGLLEELPLTWNGQPVTVRIYQCEQYRSLSL